MAHAEGLVITIDTVTMEAWASATLVGARVSLVVASQDSAALECWIAGLPHAEFVPGRHIVIDLAIDANEVVDGWRRTELGALLVEDR